MTQPEIQEDHVPRGTVRWRATVKAVQGGPVFVHHFEDIDFAALLHRIADSLDLSGAEHITIRAQQGEKH